MLHYIFLSTRLSFWIIIKYILEEENYINNNMYLKHEREKFTYPGKMNFKYV